MARALSKHVDDMMHFLFELVAHWFLAVGG